MLNVYGAAPQPSASPTAITAAPVAQRGVKTRTPPDPPPQNPFGRRFQPQDTQLSVRPSISRTAALRSQRWSCGLCRPPSPPTAETPPQRRDWDQPRSAQQRFHPRVRFASTLCLLKGSDPPCPIEGLPWGGGCTGAGAALGWGLPGAPQHCSVPPLWPHGPTGTRRLRSYCSCDPQSSDGSPLPPSALCPPRAQWVLSARPVPPPAVFISYSTVNPKLCWVLPISISFFFLAFLQFCFVGFFCLFCFSPMVRMLYLKRGYLKA